jgi:phosphoglycolate phosphatase-like HAD superfamily hydrolase
VALLHRRRGDAAYAIATAKDRPSVDRLLAAYSLGGLFPAERILDREAGPDKRAHLEALGRRLRLAAAELTFVDDKVSHLDSVARLGVRCALAAWGYNGAREHALARSRGHAVCTLEDAEAALFDGPPARPARRPL